MFFGRRSLGALRRPLCRLLLPQHMRVIFPAGKYIIAAFLKRLPTALQTSPEATPYAFASPQQLGLSGVLADQL
jgi:hypothetical protein